MADAKKVLTKLVKKGKKFFAKKASKKKEHSEGPVEAMYFDPITKQKLVVVYKQESKWWYGTRLYKIFHPLFAEQTGAEAYRWTMHAPRVLGPAADDEVVALAQEIEEKEVAVD